MIAEIRVAAAVCIILCVFISIAHATEIYQEPDDFINEVFNGHPPDSDRLWISKSLRSEIRQILEHDLGVLRVRYWQKDHRTAWILDEIGKEQPITTGIVIQDGKIESIKVLIFRESRGWEVRYPFFTDQFINSKLNENNSLDKKIDGISGATLSVRAITKLSRLALLLHDRSISKMTAETSE